MADTAEGMARTDKDAAELLGVSQAEFARLKKQIGFPAKEDGQWNVPNIIEWMADHTASDEDDDAAASSPSDNGDLSDEVDDDSSVGDEVLYVQITIPVAAPFGNLISEQFSRSVFRDHIDCTVNVDAQLIGLRHSHAGMRAAHKQFPDGKHVDNRAEAIRYLMQLIGDEVKAERFVPPPAV